MGMVVESIKLEEENVTPLARVTLPRARPLVVDVASDLAGAGVSCRSNETCNCKPTSAADSCGCCEDFRAFLRMLWFWRTLLSLLLLLLFLLLLLRQQLLILPFTLTSSLLLSVALSPLCLTPLVLVALLQCLIGFEAAVMGSSSRPRSSLRMWEALHGLCCKALADKALVAGTETDCVT